MLCCALLWLYIDWFSHIHQAYFTGAVNLTIAPVPAKQPWWIWINTLFEFIMNDCVTTTKQSTTKPCAFFGIYCTPIDVSSTRFAIRFTHAVPRDTLQILRDATGVLQNPCLLSPTFLNFCLPTCKINGDVACFQSKECIRPVQTAFCPGY